MLILLLFGMLSPAAAQPVSGKPAGEWTTWVLSSGDQFRLDAPPDGMATADEIAQLKNMMAQRDDAALAQIAYRVKILKGRKTSSEGNFKRLRDSNRGGSRQEHYGTE